MKAQGSLLVLPATAAGVPFLSPDVLDELLPSPEERLLSCSVVELQRASVGWEGAARLSFTRFLGLGADWRLIMCIRSSLVGPHNPTPSNQSGVFGETTAGRVHVGTAKWAAVVAGARPAFAVALYDGHEDARPSKKKRTADTRSELWLAETHDALSKSPLSGSEVTTLRPSKTAEPASGTSGVAFVSEAPNASPGQWLADAAAAAAAAAAGGAPLTHAVAPTLDAIVRLLRLGVRFIETALPITLARRGIALNLCLPRDLAEAAAAAAAKGQQLPPLLAITGVEGAAVHVDLHDPAFRTSRAVLSASPRAGYALGYVHHLLVAHELNATIILATHNVAVLRGLFACHRALGGAANGTERQRALESHILTGMARSHESG